MYHQNINKSETASSWLTGEGCIVEFVFECVFFLYFFFFWGGGGGVVVLVLFRIFPFLYYWLLMVASLTLCYYDRNYYRGYTGACCSIIKFLSCLQTTKRLKDIFKFKTNILQLNSPNRRKYQNDHNTSIHMVILKTNLMYFLTPFPFFPTHAPIRKITKHQKPKT